MKNANPGGSATRSDESQSKGRLATGRSASAGTSANRSFLTRHHSVLQVTSSGSLPVIQEDEAVIGDDVDLRIAPAMQLADEARNAFDLDVEMPNQGVRTAVTDVVDLLMPEDDEQFSESMRYI